MQAVKEEEKLMSIHKIAQTGIVPEYALRKWVKSGKVGVVKTGSRKYTTIARVKEYIEKATEGKAD